MCAVGTFAKHTSCGSPWERGRPARFFVHGRFAPGPSVRCGRDARVPRTPRSLELPVQAPPWGEIHPKAPRTDPNPGTAPSGRRPAPQRASGRDTRPRRPVTPSGVGDPSWPPAAARGRGPAVARGRSTTSRRREAGTSGGPGRVTHESGGAGSPPRTRPTTCVSSRVTAKRTSRTERPRVQGDRRTSAPCPASSR